MMGIDSLHQVTSCTMFRKSDGMVQLAEHSQPAGGAQPMPAPK